MSVYFNFQVFEYFYYKIVPLIMAPVCYQKESIFNFQNKINDKILICVNYYRQCNIYTLIVLYLKKYIYICTIKLIVFITP
jgi:hypothetical protein